MKIDTREKLSLLWIVVMFTMVFADIIGFMNPGGTKRYDEWQCWISNYSRHFIGVCRLA